MIERIRNIGWLAAEAGLLLIVLCILLSILLGKDGGPYISSVSENASKFLGTLPPGVTLGDIAYSPSLLVRKVAHVLDGVLDGSWISRCRGYANIPAIHTRSRPAQISGPMASEAPDISESRRMDSG